MFFLFICIVACSHFPLLFSLSLCFAHITTHTHTFTQTTENDTQSVLTYTHSLSFSTSFALFPIPIPTQTRNGNKIHSIQITPKHKHKHQHRACPKLYTLLSFPPCPLPSFRPYSSLVLYLHLPSFPRLIFLLFLGHGLPDPRQVPSKLISSRQQRLP